MIMRRVGRSYSVKRNFMAGVFLTLIVISILGSLRFQAMRLAYRLDSLNKTIESYSREETVLRQEFSGLVAPIRIYSYCKERLGMEKILVAETLHIRAREERFAAERIPEPIKGWRSRLAWIFGAHD